MNRLQERVSEDVERILAGLARDGRAALWGVGPTGRQVFEASICEVIDQVAELGWVEREPFEVAVAVARLVSADRTAETLP